jgi:hypothetical protein
MSDTHEPTVEEINAELARSKLEADTRMKALQEKLEVAKHVEGEKARKAEAARLKAKAEEKDKVKRELEEAREKAEEREKNKAGEGMMLATPADLLALECAQIVNAENAKAWAEGFKLPQAGSSKATLMPTPKTPVNLTRHVQEQERLMKPGKLGKTGEVAVSAIFWFVSFSDSILSDCQLQHVQESQGSLHLRVSGSLPGLQGMQGSVFLPRREAKMQGCGSRVGR